jgi:hypothetical protein
MAHLHRVDRVGASGEWRSARHFVCSHDGVTWIRLTNGAMLQEQRGITDVVRFSRTT